MPSFGNILRTLGPRIAGNLFAAGAAYVAAKTQGAIQIDPVQAAEWTFGILTAYNTSHRGFSALFNKGDAATGRVAGAENKASETGSTVIVPPPVK